MLPSYTQIYAAIYSAEHRAGRTSYNRTQEEMFLLNIRKVNLPS